MKSVLKLMKRFFFTLLCSGFILLVLNLGLLIYMTYGSVSNAGGWTSTSELSKELQEDGSGEYILTERGQEILEEYQAWGILVQDGTGNVLWHSDNLPKEIPLHYTISEISAFSLGYIADYPTTTAAKGENLLILGHPKKAYWKMMHNTYDYALIEGFPKMMAVFLLANLLVILVIYMVATSGILKSVRPIVKGIEELPNKEVYVKEKGLFSQLAEAMNQVSEKLRTQERELKRRESARANWISGVSHDIRTPLSMVMGYAAQLEENQSLPLEERKKAGIIRQQSVRMKNLINDLNLSSKLEYHMQPLRIETLNLVAVVRQVVVDFLNLDLEGKYPIEWEIQEDLQGCFMQGDKELLKRAFGNLITNAQVHNPKGCRITVKIVAEEQGCKVLLEDAGKGITEEMLQKLQNTPHYMLSDSGVSQPRHGLGLLIVRQIIEAHRGTLAFYHGLEGGFGVEMTFPAQRIEKGERTCTEF